MSHRTVGTVCCHCITLVTIFVIASLRPSCFPAAVKYGYYIYLIKWVYLHTFKTGGLKSVVSGDTSYLIDHLMIPITLNVILMTSNNLCSYPMTSNHEMRCRMYFWNPSVCFERDLDCGIDYDNKNRFAHPQLKQVNFFKKKKINNFPRTSGEGDDLRKHIFKSRLE